MSKVTQQQGQFKILLIGESCLDIYIKGEVNRISPEAPVPVFLEKEKESRTGMLGNVSNNLKSMLPNAHFDIITNDANQIKKTRLIDKKSNYQMIRLDEDSLRDTLNTDDIKEKNYDAVVISDYNKGFLNQSSVSYLCKRFKDTKIFVDTKKKDLSNFEGCLIKVNELENSSITKQPGKGSELIVTKGDKGCYYDGSLYPVKKVDVHDVCGAGDVFLASLVARFLETKNITEALKTANHCAALSVTKIGCYTVKRSEYENLCI